MKVVWSTLLLLALLPSGCATPPIQLRPENVTVVMARGSDPRTGVTGIGEVFTQEGKIVAHMTFRWDDISKTGGRQSVEAKWYSGERLIGKKVIDVPFDTPPYHVWFDASAIDFSQGPARFEAYNRGVLLVSKTFEIISK